MVANQLYCLQKKSKKKSRVINQLTLPAPATPSEEKWLDHWKCKMCSRVYKGKRNMKKHFRHHHGDLPRLCPDADFADLTFGQAAENLKFEISLRKGKVLAIKLEPNRNYEAATNSNQVAVRSNQTATPSNQMPAPTIEVELQRPGNLPSSDDMSDEMK